MSLYNTVGDNLLGYLHNCPILEQEIFDEDLRLNDFETSYVFKTVIMVKNYLVSVFVLYIYIYIERERERERFGKVPGDLDLVNIPQGKIPKFIKTTYNFTCCTI